MPSPHISAGELLLGLACVVAGVVALVIGGAIIAEALRQGAR